MPTYEYRCKDCSHQFDIVQSFSDDSLTVCPECGGTLKKVFGNVGISFKGGGFYKTDSRSGGSSGSGSSSGTGTSASPSKESSTSSDSSSTSTKTDSNGSGSTSSSSSSSTSSSTSGASSSSSKPAAGD